MANTKVQSEQIEDGSITADKLADGTIVAAELADNAVETAAINADAVTGAKIADNAIDSEHYTDGSIDTAHIADAQITVAKMAANSVDSDQYVDGSIDTVHLGDLQVTTAKIANGNISTAKIADNAVTSAKIDTNIDIAGTFDVTGATTLDSTLSVAGISTLNVSAVIKSAGTNDTPADLSFWHTDASIVSGDDIAVISAEGSDSGGSPPYQGAKITFDADANWDTGTSNYYPTNINFFTQDNSGTDTIAAGSRLTIKSDGNVGIGTTSPAHNLHVVSAGNAEFEVERTSGAAVFTQAQSALGVTGTSSNHDFGLLTNGSVRLRIDSSGDISITGNLNLTGGGTIEAPSSSGAENLLLNAAGGIHLRIDSNGNSGDDQVFKVMKHTDTAVFTVAETGTATISGALVLGDKISHGNGELDLYDGGSNTILKNGVTNGNVKIQAIVSGVGAGDIARFGDSALGQVDLPYQSSFMAYSPAVTNGGGNRIVFGGTWHNVGADYSTTTGKYTAPRTGRYLVTASVLINPGSTTSYERILFGINEAAADTQYGDTLTIPGNSSYHGLNISGVFQIDSGDTISVYNMGQSPTYGTSYGSFSAFYLG